MGYDRHNAIIVTCFREKEINEAHEEAKKLFDHLVSPIIVSNINQWRTFLIAPDGSNEGWEGSDEYDAKRADYKKILSTIDCLDWVEVQYGDDEGYTKIINHSDEHMEKINR